jgi:hypothetical protein
MDVMGGTAVSMVIGGITSDAAGGSFMDGALSAMAVHLWNENYANAHKLATKYQNAGFNMNVIENPSKKGDYIVVDSTSASYIGSGRGGYNHLTPEELNNNAYYLEAAVTLPFAMEKLGWQTTMDIVFWSFSIVYDPKIDHKPPPFREPVKHGTFKTDKAKEFNWGSLKWKGK